MKLTHAASGSVKWYHRFGNRFWQFSQEVKHTPVPEAAIPQVFTLQRNKNTGLPRDLHTHAYTTVTLLAGNNFNAPQHTNTDTGLSV